MVAQGLWNISFVFSEEFGLHVTPDHRLLAGKLSKILSIAGDLLSEDLPVEIEFGEDIAATYHLSEVKVMTNSIVFSFSREEDRLSSPRHKMRCKKRVLLRKASRRCVKRLPYNKKAK